jgi:phosphatidylserine decarboxylase
LWPLALFVVAFFRDPDRSITDAPGVILSPADGTVLRIDEVDETAFFMGRALHVAIFMSPFNCHINRAPVAGSVTYVRYVPGQFRAAYLEKESEQNEQNWIGFEGDGVKVLVRQIAGFLARRIICRTKPGERLARGERFGLIRFGSRCDVYVPVDAEVLVKPNEAVKGGLTTIALMRRTA